MASTLLERTRESHEEIERLERAVCADFRHEAVTHKERLAQNHRVRSMLDDAATKAKRLVRASHELPIRNPKHAKDHHGKPHRHPYASAERSPRDSPIIMRNNPGEISLAR